MINFYSIWQYLLIFIVLIVGCVYALPNAYREDFAISVAEYKSYSSKLDSRLMHNILNILKQNKIINKSIYLHSSNIQISFFSELDQKKAYEILFPIFSEKYYVSCVEISTMPSWLFAIGARPVKLGLDLKGGLYLVVQSDVQTVMNRLQDQYMCFLQEYLNEKNISYKKIYKIDTYDIEIIFENSNDRNQALFLFSRIYLNLKFDKINMNILHIAFSNDYIRSIYEYTIKHNSHVLQYRINKLKVTAPVIYRHGFDCIAIELPGVKDMSTIKSIFNNTATLELRLVNSNLNKFKINNNLIPEDSELKLDNHGNIVPLYKKIILTGDHIVNSNLDFDEYSRPKINISLDNLGKEIISKFTENNIGKLIATVFTEYYDTGKQDAQGQIIFCKRDRVINIAAIQTQLNHNFCITGMNNLREARYLLSLLHMGSLAAPIYIKEERIIGPIFSKQNINQGIMACIVGILIPICFMLLWYRYFGLIAGSALIVNLVFMLSVLSMIPGVMLTMVSIAGIVLTLSVAIDANVLINERIKEEIKQGKPMQYSIYMGYRKAFISIVDSNVTTIITAIVLYMFSTGSIQGFAITIVVGVGTSMFTSIIVTRSIVNLIYGKNRIKKLFI